MEQFELELFLQTLKKRTVGNYVMERRSVEGQPLKYKIKGTHTSFAFMTFVDNEGKVEIDLSFSIFAEEEFISDVIQAIKTIAKEGE